MKTITVIIIGILIIGSFGSMATIQGETPNKHLTKTISLSEPLINSSHHYSTLTLSESTSQFISLGKPMIPMYTTTQVLPMGSIIKKVDVTYAEPQKIALQKQLCPSPAHYPEHIDVESVHRPTIDEQVYAQNSPYPRQDFTYQLSTGIKENKQVMFVTIQCFPIRYIPSENMVYFSDHMDINIEYDSGMDSRFTKNTYDLVVIAPDLFSEALQPLIAHKNSIGVESFLKTTEDIYDEYQGRDHQEQIKYFIKDAKEQMGISYVLLIGGMMGQDFEWYLPVRYTNNYAGVPYEDGFISDLYYADLYKTIDNEIVFEDWDSNQNGIFAEFETLYNESSEQYELISKDILDCRPDVHLGRLACRSIDEVTVVVNKIIAYESTPADLSWFQRLLLVAGDTYPLPDSPDADAYEAEIDTDLTASYMTDFQPVRLWTSTQTLTRQKDVVDEINKGAGFIHMAGHANPSLLVTNTPKGEQGKVTILNMYNLALLNAYFSFRNNEGLRNVIHKLLEPVNPRLRNGEKQPVIVIGGCHNSQFNVSIKNIQRHGFFYAYGYGIHAPKCFSWYLTSLENDGAIATMGNTGLGMGYPGYNYTLGLDGWLFPRFFYHYGVNEVDILGDCFSNAIIDYVNEFDINEEIYGPAEDGPGAIRQMVEQWELFGDPSLKIGGYTL